MTDTAPEKISLRFKTQRPREDGCGGAVLQMLTGISEDKIASLIGWQDGDIRRSTWADLVRVLSGLGWAIGTPQACRSWDEIDGISLVHVHDDHFMIYDADTQIFYDPWEWEGPSTTSDRVPMSYLTVEPPITD